MKTKKGLAQLLGRDGEPKSESGYGHKRKEQEKLGTKGKSCYGEKIKMDFGTRN